MRLLIMCLLLVCVMQTPQPSESRSESENQRDRFGLTAAEAWLVNHFEEVVSQTMPIDTAQDMWNHPRRPYWSIVVRSSWTRNPTLIRMTKRSEGQISVQRTVSSGLSLWDAAAALRQATPAATAEEIARQLTFSVSDYDQDSCASLLELGSRLESLRFGPISKIVTSTSGFLYRYRVDYSAGHWIEGQLVGLAGSNPELNPPLADWLADLTAALEDCEPKRRVPVE